MTKNELMELSRECGLEFFEEECANSVFVLLAFANAILERAAVECEKQIEREKYGHAAHAVLMAQENIRSLKLPTN